RPDDNETAVRKRLEAFHRQTLPVAVFYKSQRNCAKSTGLVPSMRSLNESRSPSTDARPDEGSHSQEPRRDRGDGPRQSRGPGDPGDPSRDDQAGGDDGAAQCCVRGGAGPPRREIAVQGLCAAEPADISG